MPNTDGRITISTSPVCSSKTLISPGRRSAAIPPASTALHGEYARFVKATFRGQITRFGEATFRGHTTSFYGATFTGENTNFRKSIFSGESIVHKPFSGDTTSQYRIRQCHIQRRHLLRQCHIQGQLRSTFSYSNFGKARFSGDSAYFGGATFSGDSIDFVAATFSGKFASFENPRAWNNVTFDWDEELTNMPECMRPRDWPPMIVPEDE